MEKEGNECIVPSGPAELCFDSKTFVEESFSVDKFLQDHRNKADLETMRDDLGIYLKVLRSALIDLINKDYADFVDLSRNLIGLDKAIKKIQSPLGQLKEELLEVRLRLDGAMKEVANQLALRKELRERKRSLRSLSRVHTSLKKLKTVLSTYEESQNIILLERAAIEYCQLNFHVHKCQRDIDDTSKLDHEKVGNLLVNSVDKLFLNSIAIGEKGKPDLIKCLNYYQALNKINNSEKLYKDKIVEPALKDLITENYLKSLPRGLPALYEKILRFVEEKMKILIDVSKENNTRSGAAEFDFFLNSFWPVVQKRLETNLTSIYAAGDPDLFFQRYTDTTEFLENLFTTCESHSLDQLYNDDNFSSFLERWNLPVYFQLRFQEIVKCVEIGLSKESATAIKPEWKLAATEAVVANLNKCWQKGIFLYQLSHKFWKLSLQIIARYSYWITEKTQGKVNINFLVNIYVDVENFIPMLQEFKLKAFEKLPKLNEKTYQLLEISLEDSSTEIKSRLELLSIAIIKSLAFDCLTNLKQVNEIPRLFRNTNREAPNKPCQYVLNSFENLKKFIEQHKNNLKTKFWIISTLSTVTKQYYDCVDEVLNSVQKTEESLRKLKKARDKTNNLVTDKRTGYDYKIRLQLLLDVKDFAQRIESFGVQKTEVDCLADLLLLVETSQKLQ